MTRNLYDLVAWDPDIDRISHFSVWQDDGDLPEVRIVYLAPREERLVRLDSPLSADYLGLEFYNQLHNLPELGTIDFTRGEGRCPNGRSRSGWNFVAHYGRAEEHAWKRRIGVFR